MGMVSQAELGRLFGRTQQWVSQQQRRQPDPMPRDLAGAQAWGERHGLLSSSPAGPAALPERDAAAVGLQRAREEQIRLRIGKESGDLLERSEVQAMLIKQAAENRLCAVDYPRKARVVIERHVPDAAVVAKIMADLQPLAAELLNRSDPRQVLNGLPVDEVRAVLLAKVERILGCL